MLIFAFETLHFINVLTFTYSSQTSTHVQILFSIQEMSTCGIGYEQLILSSHRAEEAGWFVLVLSDNSVTFCRLWQFSLNVKELMCFF